jgi:diadenosine tetraphosphate (Ap4A) HIT family hydrolase
MLKFGAPLTTICQYQHWSVLLRPAQATLGCLILVAHEPVQAFSALSPASFTELHEVTTEIESALGKAFHYEKLNYLMLMMVDPDVHFHVIPRYAEIKQFNEQDFIDPGWPRVPDLGHQNKTNTSTNQRIIDHIIACWS